VQVLIGFSAGFNEAQNQKHKTALIQRELESFKVLRNPEELKNSEGLKDIKGS
jgi:hypothetical protein